jgi:sporulation protein YunB
MERLYCGKRRRAGRGALRRPLAFLLFLSIFLLLIFKLQLYPAVAALARSAAANRAESIMAAAFCEAVAGDGTLCEDLVSISYRADGGVASLSFHPQRLNAARNGLLLAVLSALREVGAVTVSIPLGNLLFGELLSGRGPGIEVRVLLAEGAHAHMESEFLSAGINQTLYRVLFSVTVNITVMTPTRPVEMTVSQTYAVSETVIVGDVPDAFTQISRLTDDVNEEDIDDLNDFGAHI